MSRIAAALRTLAAVTVMGTLLGAGEADRPWLDARRPPDARAALALAAMTLPEKLGLLHGPMAMPWPAHDGSITPPPVEAIPAAGYVPGVPRLGIPALFETDASLGVANPNGIRPGDVATAMPSGLALAATVDPPAPTRPVRWWAARPMPRASMSYAKFEYRNLAVCGGRSLTMRVEVRNSGTVKGADVPQFYLTSAAGQRVLRLIGLQRLELNPGESRIITLTADPRVLGYFDQERNQWRVKRGIYALKVGRSAAELLVGGEAGLNGI